MWMPLLIFECLKWTVWFIRNSHSNVRDSGWETAQKWLNGLRKLFDIVKVVDIGIQGNFEIAGFRNSGHRLYKPVYEGAHFNEVPDLSLQLYQGRTPSQEFYPPSAKMNNRSFI